jgi:[protein-PII] uridylyltransferase
MLVTELYVRAREFFERGEFVPEDRSARANRIRQRVQAAAQNTIRPVLDHLLGTMPDSYVLSTPEDILPDHAELVRRLQLREADGVDPALAMHWADFPELGCLELAVATRDRPGLFAMITGVLAGEGLNILAARIATSHDGIALDVFRISRPSDEPALDAERVERLEETLGAVLRGTIDVEVLVQRSVRPWLRRRRARHVPTTIEIDNEVSDTYTVLDVTTGDRVGLLFTITNCLFHQGVLIHLAKVTTMVTQALDAFYVTDLEGRKLEDPGRLAAIRDALLAALEPDAPARAAEQGASS